MLYAPIFGRTCSFPFLRSVLKFFIFPYFRCLRDSCIAIFLTVVYVGSTRPASPGNPLSTRGGHLNFTSAFSSAGPQEPAQFEPFLLQDFPEASRRAYYYKVVDEFNIA